MPKKIAVSFANVICKFGDKYVLIDLANEIFIPALADATLRREFGDTRYFFLDVQVVTSNDSSWFDAPLSYMYGRLVKDTFLTSEQSYSPTAGLVQSVQSIPSSPSSFFTLILNNHKLIYYPETSDAPTVAVLQSTLQKFLKIKHREYINSLFLHYKELGEPKSKKELLLDVPPPNLEILHLASQASIEEFVQAFGKITHVEFRIVATNDEFQMEKTYEDLRSLKKSIGAKSTKLVHDNPAGLDQKNTIEQIHAATASGNQQAVLSGVSPEGATLRGNNDDFKVSVPADGLPAGDAPRAARLVELFKEQTESGIIKVDAPPNAE